jgi:hypothetical protein
MVIISLDRTFRALKMAVSCLIIGLLVSCVSIDHGNPQRLRPVGRYRIVSNSPEAESIPLIQLQANGRTITLSDVELPFEYQFQVQDNPHRFFIYGVDNEGEVQFESPVEITVSIEFMDQFDTAWALIDQYVYVTDSLLSFEMPQGLLLSYEETVLSASDVVSEGKQDTENNLYTESSLDHVLTSLENVYDSRFQSSVRLMSIGSGLHDAPVIAGYFPVRVYDSSLERVPTDSSDDLGTFIIALIPEEYRSFVAPLPVSSQMEMTYLVQPHSVTGGYAGFLVVDQIVLSDTGEQ